METITRDSWKRLELPDNRELLHFTATYRTMDAAVIRRGLVPEKENGQWFIYHEDGWVFLHDSRTGACIYWLKLVDDTAGVRVVESWVNREPGQHAETDVDYDRLVLAYWIDRLLLGKSPDYPRSKRAIPAAH